MSNCVCCVSSIVKYEVNNAEIKSVEAGSIKSSPSNPVIAFTVSVPDGGKDIKCILKGKLAFAVYNKFLKDCMTKTKIISESDIHILKTCTVSFVGTLKEDRKKEIVLKDIDKISFDFKYFIEQ